MKDPLEQLQSSWYSLLDESITYSGNTVAVYDAVSESPTYPYIQFNDVSNSQDDAKDTFGQDVTVQISIVDRFQSRGTWKGVYSVSNDVQQTIVKKPPDIPFILTDFNVYSVTLISSPRLKESTDTYVYYRLEPRFRHRIEQTT